MQLEPDKPVSIRVIESTCPLMKAGDTLYLRGPMIDMERSSSICVSALAAIYPWVVTARFGVESKSLGYQSNKGYRVICPDKLVEFEVVSGNLSGNE